MNRGRTPIKAYGLFLCLLPLLVSCGREDSTPTPEQNRQLANADAMLNAAPEDLSNIDENALGPAERNSEAPDQ